MALATVKVLTNRCDISVDVLVKYSAQGPAESEAAWREYPGRVVWGITAVAQYFHVAYRLC